MIDDAVILTMCNNNNSYLVTDTQITGQLPKNMEKQLYKVIQNCDGER